MMKKVVVGAMLVSGILFGATAASAQDVMQSREDRPLRAVVAIVVDATGLEPREILGQMRDGASLAEVIESSGGSVDVVTDQVVAELTERINQRAADGQITQERAEMLLENLEVRVNEVLNGEFRGMGQRRLTQGVLNLAAEQTGLTREEIMEQIRAGSTLADVLTASGVDVNAFIDTVMEPIEGRVANLRERLTERITSAGQ